MWPDLEGLPRSPRSLIVLVALCLTALFGATTLLSAYYHEAKHVRADRHFTAASALAASGRLADATREFRAGLSLERDNVPAQRGLALALLSLGRNAEAATYFTDLLRREPTDGAANRGLARIAAAQQRSADATVYYQRAIYGRWPDDMPDARLETRFELIDHLRSLRGRDVLHAELLRLKAEVPPDRTATHRRIARLLAETGATADAVDSLLRAAAAAPRDVGLLVDLADTQVAAGLWADARATLQRARSLDRREDLGERLAIVERVLALDPTRPRLRIAERTRRARRVLAAVLQETRDCAPPDTAPLREQAQLHLRRSGALDAEAAEGDLDLASRIWASAPECHLNTSQARALAHVLRQVGASDPQQP